MTKLAFLAALSVLASPAWADPEGDAIDDGLVTCATTLGETTPKVPGTYFSSVSFAERCRRMRAHVRQHPLVRKGRHWFLAEEADTRERLDRLGIKVGPEQYVADFVLDQVGDRVVAAVFTGGGSKEGKGSVTRAYQLFWRTADGAHDLLDPGMFPFGRIVLFGKTKGSSWRELANVPADATLDLAEAKANVEYDAEARCPSLGLAAPGRFGVCFSDHYALEWPEVLVYVDHLASTGVLTHVMIFRNGKFEEATYGEHFFQKVDGNWLLFSRTTGEGYDDNWYWATPGHVRRFDAKARTFVKDDGLTARFFPFTKTKRGSSPGLPKEAGMFCTLSQRQPKQCLEIIE